MAVAATALWWPLYGRVNRLPLPHDASLRVTNEEAALAATISYPASGSPPFPAVVIVHGSGRVTRDQVRGLRDPLIAAGLAVLTYDKRGVGKSTGEYDNVGVRTSAQRMPLLGRDALACLRALKAVREIDPARVGFFGSSQAGWIIPAAIGVAQSPEVAFAVILSGPATSVGLEHAYSETTGNGIRAHETLTDAAIDARVDAYKGAQGFDHAEILRSMRTPTLWLLGSRDESIPIRHTERNLRALMAAGVPITLKVYEGGNHGLFGPLGPIPFWADVTDWLRAQRILQ
ncbi:MAG: alpha/beta hydrolase [Vicinamibacterales bacterium]